MISQELMSYINDDELVELRDNHGESQTTDL